jgi:hypothetical protein
MAEELPCLRRHRHPGKCRGSAAVPILQGEAFQFGDNSSMIESLIYGSSRRATRLERISDKQHLQGEHV